VNRHDVGGHAAHNRSGSFRGTRLRMSAQRSSRGFTLMEIVLATALLALGLTLAFATIGAATKTTQRGEAIASDSERMRAVQGFMRRRLTAARPVPYSFDQTNGLASRFEGEPDRMKFVADLPDYLGRGGPYLHEFAVEGDGDQQRLTLSLNMVLAGQVVEEPDPRPPELLAGNLESARFRYRALSAEGGLGEWMERWQNVDQMPLLVEITLTDVGGRQWPPLVVALPLASTIAGTVTPEVL
jgi:general secretion pathway protein J